MENFCLGNIDQCYKLLWKVSSKSKLKIEWFDLPLGYHDSLSHTEHLTQKPSSEVINDPAFLF